MKESLKLKLFYLIGISFILFGASSVYQDEYLIFTLPVVLLFLYLILFKLDSVLLFLNFLIPLSVQIDDIGNGFGLSLPDEPLMMAIMLLSVFKFMVDGAYDKRILRHPVSVWIIINIAWHFVTSFTSEIPLVSFKYATAQLWFVVVFYFLGVVLFKNKTYLIQYHWLYMSSLAIVVLYTLALHSRQGLTQESSFYISRPFYIAHGIYAACQAFFVPMLVATLWYVFKLKLNWYKILGVVFLLLLFLVGIFFSYTRAAWLSVLVAAVMIVPISFRLRFKMQLTLLVIGVGLFFVFQDQIYYVLSKNKQDSGEGFSKHLKSASNIKTDASNVERINRWMTAIEMFKERPFIGFGPGTYHFCYAPYQLAKYKTLITTNFGNQGNAHSELLNPLSEMGILGMVNIIMIVFWGLNTAFNRIYHTKDPWIKLLLIANALGLITYFTHGLLNNYLDSSKVAPLVWGGLAMITAIDLYYREQEAE